jgi:O-acetyl-ADP-ribose deacetylase (regulator of RNase III)
MVEQMTANWHHSRITIVTGDIASLEVDAVVNAANSRLAGGSGVDGAIHQAAGYDQLQAVCREIGGCPTGEVRVTSGFNLPAKYIFHAVGPVWRGGHGDEEKLLSSCYSNALALAQQYGVKTIAFPAISCGVYGYPPEQAVPCAVATVLDCLPLSPAVEKVVFCCFSADMAQRYQQVLTPLISA